MKAKRQSAIREIIAERPIRTQEDLASALSERGFAATQATVSRDIREMHLVKSLTEEGEYRYVQETRDERGMDGRLARILADSVIEMDYAGHLLIIRTISGSAHVAAEAIDTLHLPEIVGTIAGDNTILVIARTEESISSLIQQFSNMLG